MKAWRIILATLVIFAAGAMTGALFTRSAQRPQTAIPQRDPLLYPHHVQEWFLGKMKKELDLTPEQQASVGKIFADSRGRIKVMFEIISPELKAELRVVHDKVSAELNPEQRAKFEEMLKQRPRKSGDRDRSSSGKDGEKRPDSPSGPEEKK